MLNANTKLPLTRLYGSNYLRATKWQFYWLCGLIISFAYERPFLYVSSLDRVNPRLFDIMTILGIFFILPRLRGKKYLPSVFYFWAAIVAVFCACSFVWTLAILPWEYGMYSLYFAAKYVEGLIAIYIAIKIPLSLRQKELIYYLTITTGIFVAIYSLPQYLFGNSRVQLASGDELNLGEGAFIGPLGYGYYHLAMFSGMSCVLALSTIFHLKGLAGKLLMSVIAIFVAWPAFFCGARTGVMYTATGVVVLIILSRKIRWWTLSIGVAAVIVSTVFLPNIYDDLFVESYTFQRLESFNVPDSDNSLEKRLMLFTEFSLSNYMWQGAPVPFIGAGFYVAPTFRSSIPYYRVGYGFHNAYLFAFEQGGTVAFGLFIAFLVSILNYLNSARKRLFGVEKGFANAMLAIFFATIVVGMIGHGFWFGSTMHYAFYLLLLYIIAGTPGQGKQV